MFTTTVTHTWYSGSWWINHGHEANKAKARKREVLLVRVKGISLGVFVSREHEVTEAKDTLSQASQLHVSRFKGILPVLSERPLCAVNHDGAAYKMCMYIRYKIFALRYLHLSRIRSGAPFITIR